MINYEDIRVKKTIRNIHQAFIELFKEKDLEKWGISKPKTSNLRTIESGILEQFDREMEEERVAKLEAKSSKAKQSEEDDEEIECEVNE